MLQSDITRLARLPITATCTRTAIVTNWPNILCHRVTKNDETVRQKTTASSVLKVESEKNWGSDPVANQYKYWNPHTTTDRGQRSYLLDMSPESIKVEAKIISLSALDDPANATLHNAQNLPIGTTLLSVGTTLEEIQSKISGNSQPNVVFVSPSCPYSAIVLPKVLTAYPSIEWVHCRSAGIDFVESDELIDVCKGRSTSSSTKPLHVTNAKGQFSSSLAEYALGACTYFAKDFPRLVRQQQKKQWENFDIQELYVSGFVFHCKSILIILANILVFKCRRGKTMGIIGYGDIGRACAKLASVYGMRICALRRHPFLSRNDPLCDVVYGRDRTSLHQIMSESDYIVCSTPSTVETRGMIDAEAFDAVKQDAVFINLGRGPVIDEDALISALQMGKLKGAALDVFAVEPLPSSSKLWDMPNVLISPHNMDQTATFMHDATAFFLNENLPRFLLGEELLNPVDPILGY